MEYLTRPYDESDRLYQSLLDVSNASWPDPVAAHAAAAGRSSENGVTIERVLNIRIKLETQPAR